MYEQKNDIVKSGWRRLTYLNAQKNEKIRESKS